MSNESELERVTERLDRLYDSVTAQLASISKSIASEIGDLRRVAASLETWRFEHEKTSEQAAKSRDDHETRLREIERKLLYGAGVVAGLGLASGALGHWLMHSLGGK